MQNNKFELEDRLKELEKEEQELVEDIKRLKELEEDGEEELVEYIKRLKELEEEKQDLVENMKRLETQIDEKLSELDIMREIEEKEWNEKYETSDGKYQYMKQKQGTKITDPATLLKLELKLSRKKTRG
jgi:chromosome segregation ATPase